jgi:hypothetical protein
MQQFKSTPIPDNTLIGDLAMPRFLKAYDLTDRWKVQQVTVTISRANFEEIYDKEARKKKMVPVLYFKAKTGEEFPRGMCLDAPTNVDALRKATGAKTAGQMVGKRITITAEIVKAFGKNWDVLRILPEPPVSNGSQSEPSMPEPSIVDGMQPGEEDLEDIIGEPPEGPDEPIQQGMSIEKPATPARTPAPVTTTKPKTVAELKELAKKQPVQAFNQITARLGIDATQANSIYRSKGNYAAAFEHVVKEFASQLGEVA